jgi:acyl-CoA synthetase (AMP-forming)/AMP-acid ligase II
MPEKLVKNTSIINKREFRKRRRQLINKHGDVLQDILDLPFDNERSWGLLLEDQAKKIPENIAVKYEDKEITYKDFNKRTNQYANYFLSLGIKKDDIIEIFMPNKPDLLMIISALSKIGGVSSLINTDLRGRSLIHSFETIPGKFIIIDPQLLEPFLNIKSNLNISSTQKIFYISPTKSSFSIPKDFINLSKEIRKFSEQNPKNTVDVKTNDPIAYVFTSGTTGLPKAAIRTHYGMLSGGYLFGVVMAGLSQEDTLYLCLPIFHATGLSVGWPAAFASGATLALDQSFSVKNFWSRIKEYDATSFVYVGEMCTYLMNQPEKPEDKENKIKAIIGNGLRTEIWKSFKNRFDIDIIGEFYGASEVPAVFANLLNFDCTLGMCSSPYSIVKYDFENNEVYRNEDGYMEKVEPGEIGLLLFENKGTTKYCGYTNQKATQKKIFNDVFTKGDSWANTGDLLRDLGSNHAQFFDRLGDTFRWKGHNVSTTEVEKILNSIDQIKISTVYGVDIPHTEGKAGMAAIIPKIEIHEFDFKGLYDILSRHLPSYAIPVFLRFKSGLTTTSTHKLKKNPLKVSGFSPINSEDSYYVYFHPGTKYIPLTEKIYNQILNKEYKL